MIEEENEIEEIIFPQDGLNKKGSKIFENKQEENKKDEDNKDENKRVKINKDESEKVETKKEVKLTDGIIAVRSKREKNNEGENIE